MRGVYQKHRFLERKSYSDKLLIGVNRADLFRQGSCRNSDDSSRDELIFWGSYSDKAIPAICYEKQFEASPSPRYKRARWRKPWRVCAKSNAHASFSNVL